jgi:hypothetical protein
MYSEMQQMKKWIQRIIWLVALVAVVGLLSSCHGSAQGSSGCCQMANKTRVVVVTGGHDFDHDPFFTMLRQCPLDVTEAAQKDHSGCQGTSTLEL